MDAATPPIAKKGWFVLVKLANARLHVALSHSSMGALHHRFVWMIARLDPAWLSHQKVALDIAPNEFQTAFLEARTKADF